MSNYGCCAKKCLLGTSLALFLMNSHIFAFDLPTQFDLRDYNGENFVTSVKSQSGGTCWTHGAMAAIEGNLLMTGAWTNAGESGEPNLAEYHLDWWNGFNQNNNDDTEPPTGGGLVVHEGGDYRVTSAYLSRGEGAVRDIDGQIFATPPSRFDPSYHYFYIPHIEWYTANPDLSNIDLIKQKIMEYGVMGTCMYYSDLFIDASYNHYQPPSDANDPNHAISIVGWDDTRVTQGPLPGAWLCKNSWGSGWGYDGYFWISYYDKHACKHPEMGAISFYGVEPIHYDRIYYHDYHGWRNTKVDINEAFNKFIAQGHEYGSERVKAVSFYTAAENVDYTVTIYDRFESGALSDQLATKTGFIEHTGFHTVPLDLPVEITNGDDFYIYVYLSNGGHPFDETSDVPVLLGARYRTIVESKSGPDQSYFYDGISWQDFYNENSTGNFCIKALSEFEANLDINLPDGIPEYLEPGQETMINIEIIDGARAYLEGSGQIYYRFDDGIYYSAPITNISGDLYSAALPAAQCGDIPSYYFAAECDDAIMVYCPIDAPTSTFSGKVGEKISVIEDNFETDNGWTTGYNSATAGFWQRGVPVDDDAWAYDPAADGDGSGQCWLTQNEMGNTDLDNGSVTLVSPVLDMSEGGNISYYYYLFLTSTEGNVDRIQVEIDNGSNNWTEIASHAADGGSLWHFHSISRSEMEIAGVVFNSTMRVRFTAYDLYPQSVVEAGIDGFEISFDQCNDPYLCGDINNDEMVDILDIVYLINYRYKVGPAPVSMNDADVNHDGNVDILDIVYLINFKYKAGPEPDCL